MSPVPKCMCRDVVTCLYDDVESKSKMPVCSARGMTRDQLACGKQTPTVTCLYYMWEIWVIADPNCARELGVITRFASILNCLFTLE